MWRTAEGGGGGGGGGSGSSGAPARAQRLYTAHTAAITAVAAHPTLPLVATAQLPETPLRPGDEGFTWRRGGLGEGGGGACVRVWHAGSCSDAWPPLRVPRGAGGLVCALAFSPCGRHLLAAVAGGSGHTLLLWTLVDGEEGRPPAAARPEALGLPPGATPLYTIYVVDAPAPPPPPPPPAPLKGAFKSSYAMGRPAPPVPPPQKFAVLLVPVGREHEWAFGSAAGQASLARRAGVARLLVVQLGSGGACAARFSRMTAAEVQAELAVQKSSGLPSVEEPVLPAQPTAYGR
jgi:hypothetical protein